MDSDEDNILSQALDNVENSLPDKPERFSTLVDDEFAAGLAEGNFPLNTRKRQNWAVNMFNTWQANRNKFVQENIHKDITWKLLPDTSVESMSTEEINNCGPKFIMEARK